MLSGVICFRRFFSKEKSVICLKWGAGCDILRIETRLRAKNCVGALAADIKRGAKKGRAGGRARRALRIVCADRPAEERTFKKSTHFYRETIVSNGENL